MKILIFSVMPLPLLERLGEHLAGKGHDVINLSGKRSRGRSAPGVRRIIMNFDESSWPDDQAEAWKQAVKNGSFGLRTLGNLASSWEPDIILCRSGKGAAFFIRNAFPDTFLCSFAAASHEAGISIELDSRLFLESQLRFAPDSGSIVKFPPILRNAIKPEPICIDTDFFRPEKGSPFSCWKLKDTWGAIGVVLTGLTNDELKAWIRSIADFLVRNREIAIVALTDKRGISAGIIKSLDAIDDRISERIFTTGHLERDDWRNLCASVPVVFTSQSQKSQALECVAAGGSAWIAIDKDLMEIPGARLLSSKNPVETQLREIRFIGPNIRAIEAISLEYSCSVVVPEFAARVLGEYGEWMAAR